MAVRIYELVMLLAPSVTKDEVKSISADLCELLTEFDAKDVVCNFWHRVSLAYKIHGFGVVFGLHLSFALDQSERVLTLKARVCKRFKFLRLGLFLSNVVSASVKPSFCIDGSE